MCDLKRDNVNSLTGGHQDGQIQLWDVGVPSLPSYSVTQVHLLTIPAVARDVYNLTFSATHDLLLAGCDGGLVGWKIDMKKVEDNERYCGAKTKKG